MSLTCPRGIRGICPRGIRMRHYNNELIKLCKKAFMNKDNDELGEWTDVNKVPQNE